MGCDGILKFIVNANIVFIVILLIFPQVIDGIKQKFTQQKNETPQKVKA